MLRNRPRIRTCFCSAVGSRLPPVVEHRSAACLVSKPKKHRPRTRGNRSNSGRPGQSQRAFCSAPMIWTTTVLAIGTALFSVRRWTRGSGNPQRSSRLCRLRHRLTQRYRWPCPVARGIVRIGQLKAAFNRYLQPRVQKMARNLQQRRHADLRAARSPPKLRRDRDHRRYKLSHERSDRGVTLRGYARVG